MHVNMYFGLVVFTFAASRKTVSLMCRTPLRITARATPENTNTIHRSIHADPTGCVTCLNMLTEYDLCLYLVYVHTGEYISVVALSRCQYSAIF